MYCPMCMMLLDITHLGFNNYVLNFTDLSGYAMTKFYVRFIWPGWFFFVTKVII